MYQGQNVDIGTPSAGTVGTDQLSYPLQLGGNLDLNSKEITGLTVNNGFITIKSNAGDPSGTSVTGQCYVDTSDSNTPKIYTGTNFIRFYTPPLEITTTGSPVITTPGDGYKYYTYHSSGSFLVNRDAEDEEVYVWCVGGGGGGSSGTNDSNSAGAGGGGGGMAFGWVNALSSQACTITIGAGGGTAAGGGNSGFVEPVAGSNDFLATGGNAGSTGNPGTGGAGGTGTIGSGTTASGVTYGDGVFGTGGTGGDGSNVADATGGAGGDGNSTHYTGGGGGGAGDDGGAGVVPSAGGKGIGGSGYTSGGNGGFDTVYTGVAGGGSYGGAAGTVGTSRKNNGGGGGTYGGGGGGGADNTNASGSLSTLGGHGADGVVIVRIPA